MPKHVTESTGASVSAEWQFLTGAKVTFDAGSELTNSGTVTLAGTLALTGDQVQVTEGGTGATTAAIARTNLGVAASGANSDITSLAGLTTPLSVAQGGTGAATAANALESLTSTMADYGIVYKDTVGLAASSAGVSPYQEVYSNASGAPAWRDKVENFVVAVTAPTSSPTEVSKAAQFYFPFAGFVSAVHAGVSTDSNTKDVIVDIDIAGTSIFSTKLYIDQGAYTSATAGTVAVIGAGVSNFTQWQRCDIHVDQCGTTAEGLVVSMVCVRTN